MPDQTDYSLIRLRNGAYSVRADACGETMHPGVGPAAEAEALYVRQTRLVERLRRHTGEFVVWDVGLGAAANAVAVLWHARETGAAIRLLSFDHTDAPLRFALAHRAELNYLAGYEAAVEQLLRERRVEFAQGGRQIDWQLLVGDFPGLLDSAAADDWPKPHLILFDPFSPSKNPAMWTLPLFERLCSLLDPQRPCVMPTYSRSTLLRVTLLLAGFQVGTGHASGLKEETTVAANCRELVAAPLDQRWLDRARRSDSAEPLRDSTYRKAPLSPASWDRLRQLPQFHRI